MIVGRRKSGDWAQPAPGEKTECHWDFVRGQLCCSRLGSVILFFAFLSAVSVLLTLLGCATPKTPLPPPPPDFGPKGSSPITFTRVIFRLPSGGSIGAHYDGLLKVRKFGHTWTSGITVGGEEFKIIACEQMRSRDYTVLGSENLLFGKDESAKAEFQLGGTVEALQWNTYAPLAGNFSECTITVEWQLNNALRDQVVFKRTTSGKSRSGGIGTQCIKTAFLMALDGLLGDPELIAAVKLKKQLGPSVADAGRETIEIAISGNERVLSLPKDMDEVLKSAILLRPGAAVGSGVVISEDGYALTAAHVVSPLREVSVRMRSGLELTAAVIRTDPEQDVALIKLPGRGHIFLPVWSSSTPNIGSDLYAVGAPSGESLAFSVTRGVVSGVREAQGRRYIQTDAALSPGNSGGPLLSPDGKVVGIVSWKIVAAGFEGLSFGVPISAIFERLGVKLK